MRYDEIKWNKIKWNETIWNVMKLNKIEMKLNELVHLSVLNTACCINDLPVI